jgi:hypothetical protein
MESWMIPIWGWPVIVLSRSKYLVVIALILFSSLALADIGSDDPSRPILGQTGQIFTLNFTPAGNLLTVGIVGDTVATAGPERVILLGRQYPNGNDQPKDLTIHPVNNTFEILDTIDPNSSIEIEILDRLNNRKEIFNIEQKGRP